MTFGHREITDIAAILRAAAHQEIMPRFCKLTPDAIRRKSSDTDLVTDADEAAEAAITLGLSKRFPGCLVVGEEACAADPDLIHKLSNAEFAFTVDPIDGTSNYAANLPLFGTMVAAVKNGDVIASLILDPVSDSMAVALRGEGAWIESDGNTSPLHVAQPVAPDRMTGVASWRFLPEPARSRVAKNMARLNSTWDYRCAAHQYRLAAGGHCHFLLFNRLMPWDHLPGWLLHREAGGYAAHFDGTEYRPGDLEGGLICVPDAESFQALRSLLLDPA